MSNEITEESIEIFDDFQMLEPEEAERWGRLLSEFRQYNQEAVIFQFQIRELEAQFKSKVLAIESNRQVSLARATEIRDVYEQLTSELCEKYQIHRDGAVIDVDARTIRDESSGL